MIKLDIFIKRVESDDRVNVDMIKQETEADKLGSDNLDEDKVNHIMK